jgi:hypothetical protein
MVMQIFLALNRGLHWYVYLAVIIPEDRDI